MDQRVLSEAGHVHDLDVRVMGRRRIGNGFAVHAAGQNDVGEQQINMDEFTENNLPSRRGHPTCAFANPA